MKKILLSGLVLLALTSSQNAFAGKHHEFGFGMGVVTHNQVKEVVTDISSSVASARLEIDDLDWSKSYNFNYAFHPINLIGIGLIASYQTSEGKVYESGANWIGGNVTNKYLTIMPMLSLNWFDVKVFCMYSKFALGYTFVNAEFDGNGIKDRVKNTKEQDHKMGFQATPIAMEAGLPFLRLFAEFGYGNQGLVNVGLKARF